MTFVIALEQVNQSHTALVGGKNAALGEMIQHVSALGINIPQGFAVTTNAYREFLNHNALQDMIAQTIAKLDVTNITELNAASSHIQNLMTSSALPAELSSAIADAYQQLTHQTSARVAVRSSATSEDGITASFAGQLKSYLNVQGISTVENAMKQVFASLFSSAALSYCAHNNINILDIEMSVGIQRMVPTEQSASGVLFTLDTESGFTEVIFITANYGQGETIVQGMVNPDEFYVSKRALAQNKQAIVRRNLGSKHIKSIIGSHIDSSVGATNLGELNQMVDVERSARNQFSISDEHVTAIAAQALILENHFKTPMDIEWAIEDGSDTLYILQARAETVKSNQKIGAMERYLLRQKGSVLCEGRSIGQRIAAGTVRIIPSINELHLVQTGDVVVCDMTDPDWEPIMKKAAAIVTNRGGRTCHAAIIARELGLPAVVGCGNATDILATGQAITVSCAEGDTGYIYDGDLDFEIQKNTIDSMPKLPLALMMNIGNPDRAFDYAQIPNHGIGLARLEFIINRMIGIHPKAIINFDSLPPETQNTVLMRSAGYPSPIEFYVEKLAEGISSLACAFADKRVIVRLSDFKSNEYANLIGGKLYEPEEDNPIIGYRGASRLTAESSRDCFELECRAIKKVRDEMGFTNVEIMVPFVRTIPEAILVNQLLDKNGLSRGTNNLRVMMMCELPANALLADQFLEHFDGFSIGSNDLTQLVLGVDRESGIVAHIFDENDAAVKMMLEMAIKACKKAGKYIGICGQGPSDKPEFAQWLVAQGIDSISLNPDSVLDTWFLLVS